MNYIQELIKYSKIAEEKNLVTSVEGNISVIDRETGLTYITPSGKMKLLLTEEMIGVVDSEGKQVGGNIPRSSEYLLHEAALKARPDCTACVHTHAPFLSSYAICEKDIEMPESANFVGIFKKIKCLPFGMPGTHEIHQGIEEALAKTNVCLVGRHGAVAVGEDLATAIGTVEAIEGLCKAYFLAQRVGTPKKFDEELYQILLNF